MAPVPAARGARAPDARAARVVDYGTDRAPGAAAPFGDARLGLTAMSAYLVVAVLLLVTRSIQVATSHA